MSCIKGRETCRLLDGILILFNTYRIQTHPSKPVSMSGIDIHKQFGYQSIIPESVLIVLSPNNKPNVGIFQLTGLGMSVVDKCERAGFHDHEGVEINDLFAKVGGLGRDNHVSVVDPGGKKIKIVAMK